MRGRLYFRRNGLLEPDFRRGPSLFARLFKAAVVVGMVLMVMPTLGVGLGLAMAIFRQYGGDHGQAKLQLVRGKAYLTGVTGKEFGEMHDGDAVVGRQGIRIGDGGKAVLTLPEGTQVRLDGGSRMFLAGLDRPNERVPWRIHLTLNAGRAWVVSRSQLELSTAGGLDVEMGGEALFSSQAQGQSADDVVALDAGWAQAGFGDASQRLHPKQAIDLSQPDASATDTGASVLRLGVPREWRDNEKEGDFTLFNRALDAVRGKLVTLTDGRLYEDQQLNPVEIGKADGHSDLHLDAFFSAPGSLEAEVMDPSGHDFWNFSSAAPALRVELAKAQAGGWSYRLHAHGGQLSYWAAAYVVSPSVDTPEPFFSESTDCQRGLEAGQPDSLAVHSLDAAGPPQMAAGALPPFAQAVAGKDGSMVIHFNPSSQEPAQQWYFSITSSLLGRSQVLYCRLSVAAQAVQSQLDITVHKPFPDGSKLEVMPLGQTLDVPANGKIHLDSLAGGHYTVSLILPDGFQQASAQVQLDGHNKAGIDLSTQPLLPSPAAGPPSPIPTPTPTPVPTPTPTPSPTVCPSPSGNSPSPSPSPLPSGCPTPSPTPTHTPTPSHSPSPSPSVSPSPSSSPSSSPSPSPSP